MADSRVTNQQIAKSVGKLTGLVEDLSGRLEQLESKVGTQGRGSNAPDDRSESHGLCSLRVVEEPIYAPEVVGERLSLIRVFNKKWVNGTILHYHFMTDQPNRGSRTDVEVVRRAFKAWEDVGIGLKFAEVDDISEAEVRIGFRAGDGAWSYVGRDILEIGQSKRTMNFGWRLAGTANRPEDIDTPIHEIGHTLGFPHEHQNPKAGIEWNEEAVYADLAGPPNFWSRDKTYYNIIRKLPQDEVDGSDWDPNSIMHYPFKAGMINHPVEYRDGLDPQPGLSETDKEEVRKFYPPEEEQDEPAELNPFQSELLSLEAGGQANFVVKPQATREYTISTFGGSDTVMVLFEKVDGEFRFLAGDDDSGYSTNARIQVLLRPQREYMLRIRLYSQYAEGDTAVLMW